MRFLVSAGPTREPLDDIRFLSNRSTGRMGYAVAAVAAERGHEVVLVSGPTELATPRGVARIDVHTAREMLNAIADKLSGCEVLVMCAAVCDIRPSAPVSGKIKKHLLPDNIKVEPTPDILREVRAEKGNRIFVGFAAETGDPVPEARRKLVEKRLDLIVANDVSRPDSGFEVETNKAFFIDAGGLVRDLPLMTKSELASEIVNWIETRARKPANSPGQARNRG